MSQDINSITITGRVGQDPVEGSYGADGKLAKFSVAVNRRKKQGVDQPPSWFNVTVFGQAAGPVMQYLTRGREVAVTGRMEATTREKDGSNVTYWDLIANDVKFMGPAPENREPGAAGAASDPDSICF